MIGSAHTVDTSQDTYFGVLYFKKSKINGIKITIIDFNTFTNAFRSEKISFTDKLRELERKFHNIEVLSLGARDEDLGIILNFIDENQVKKIQVFMWDYTGNDKRKLSIFIHFYTDEKIKIKSLWNTDSKDTFFDVIESEKFKGKLEILDGDKTIKTYSRNAFTSGIKPIPDEDFLGYT